MSIKQPWHRQPGESEPAHKAFKTYLTLGAGRTIEQAFAVVKKSPGRAVDGGWYTWAEKFDWAARAQAQDDHLADVELRARERQAQKQAQVWAERETEVREEGFKISKDLLEKARAMLSFPLTQRRTESADGKEITIIEPSKWNLATAAKFVDTAYKTASLSVGLETERIMVQIQFKDQIDLIMQSMIDAVTEVVNDDITLGQVLERFNQKLATVQQVTSG